MQQALKENPASYYQKAIERANELTWDKSGKALVDVYEKVSVHSPELRKTV
jgi:hypothetical protein